MAITRTHEGQQHYDHVLPNGAPITENEECIYFITEDIYGQPTLSLLNGHLIIHYSIFDDGITGCIGDSRLALPPSDELLAALGFADPVKPDPVKPAKAAYHHARPSIDDLANTALRDLLQDYDPGVKFAALKLYVENGLYDY